MLVLARLTAFFMVAPIFSGPGIPARIRVILSVFLAILIMPFLSNTIQTNVVSVQMILLALVQVVIGIAIGFVFAIVFQVFVIAGQIVAFQSGLGFATMMDPSTSTQVGFVSRFYWIAASLVFLAIDGHLHLIQLIAESFKVVPLTTWPNLTLHFSILISYSSILYKCAVSIALPAIFAILSVNAMFGLMNRSAPQLHIFTIGFPLTIVFGLMIIYFNFDAVMPRFEDIFKVAFVTVKKMLGAGYG